MMIPPTLRELPPNEARTSRTSGLSSTGHAVQARMARPQRRYASNYNISLDAFVHQPAKPMTQPAKPMAPPDLPVAESTFDKWRAAADAERERLGLDDVEPFDAAMPDPAPPRRRLQDALLGTTAVVLLGVLGGAVYYAWTHDDGSAAAAGGLASKGSALSAFVQPVVGPAAKTGPQAAPDLVPAPMPGEDVATAVPPLRQAPQPAAPLPPLPVTPDGPASATLLADKPVLAALPVPASGVSTTEAESVLPPERAAAALIPLAAASEPGAAAPAPTATAETRPGPERAATAVVLPARLPDPDTAQPLSIMPAPMVERTAADAVPSVAPREPDAAPTVPAIATATVRLAPAPEWAVAGDVPLAPPPEAAALPPAPAAAPVVPAGPTLAAGPAAPVSAEMARTILQGVDAQQVMSTMQLVQQMSLLVHDMHGEGLRYRTEVTELTGAVQEKAANLEERLKQAEARSASGAESSWRRSGTAPVARDPRDGGELRADAVETARARRRYHVQAGSADAVVLSDGNAGPEQAARLLVIVGDQVPGAGRVRAIVPRGRSWLVQTDHGEIR